MAGGVTQPSAAAELSSLHTQLDEVGVRIEHLVERYAASPDSAVAAELVAAERAVARAQRALQRAMQLLGPASAS